MTENIHQRIKTLLEETNDAFVSCGGSMNFDYAAFASMRLSEFKRLLENPQLTGNQLRRMLRKGKQKQLRRDPEGCWATFIAGYVANSSNQNAQENLEKTVHYGLDKVYAQNNQEKP